MTSSYISTHTSNPGATGAQQSSNTPVVATAVPPTPYFNTTELAGNPDHYNVFSGHGTSFSLPRPTPCAEYPLRNSFPGTGPYSDAASNSLSKLAICADSIGSVSTSQPTGSSALGSVPGSFSLTDDPSTAAAMAAAHGSYATPYGPTPYGVPSPYTNLAAASNPYQSAQFHQHGLSQYMGNYAAMAAGAYSQFNWMGGMGGRNPYGFMTHPGGKKGRQTYSRYQTTILESQYRVNKYATKAQRRQLAETTLLRDRQIKIWFQNRRMKDKKEQKKQDEERQLTGIKTSDSCKQIDRQSANSTNAPQQVELQATNTSIPLKQELTSKPAGQQHPATALTVANASPLKYDSKMEPYANSISRDQLFATHHGMHSYYQQPCYHR